MTGEVKKTSAKRVVGDGTPGPGRPKGAQNKFTVQAKEAFQMAFEGMGGVAALEAWAKANKTEFFKLYARLIPQAVEGSLNLGDVSDQPMSEDAWSQQTPAGRELH